MAAKVRAQTITNKCARMCTPHASTTIRRIPSSQPKPRKTHRRTQAKLGAISNTLRLPRNHFRSKNFETLGKYEARSIVNSSAICFSGKSGWKREESNLQYSTKNARGNCRESQPSKFLWPLPLLREQSVFAPMRI